MRTARPAAVGDAQRGHDVGLVDLARAVKLLGHTDDGGPAPLDEGSDGMAEVGATGETQLGTVSTTAAVEHRQHLPPRRTVVTATGQELGVRPRPGVQNLGATARRYVLGERGQPFAATGGRNRGVA